MTAYFIQAFIYLCAAVIAVPISKRLGLGSVLGYLIAGVMIGPILGLVGSETTSIQHFAEFGVVMMLFLVGLELEPRMLWHMKNRLLGLGGLQVLLTTLAITAIVFLLVPMDWRTALAIGLVLSLSSTAIVLQTFNEKGLTNTEGGRGSFSVLLFQDIAVIPMLALIPLLALPEFVDLAATASDDHHEDYSLAAHLPGWAYAIAVLFSIVAVVLGGHYLSRPLLRFIAATHLREMFTATALLFIIGVAALMSLVGLSPALGTFLAGVVMANSEFRHELETDIEPFKGLLLGLFFITVGAGIDFSVIEQNLAIVIGATIAIILLKGAILFVLAKTFRLAKQDGWLFALSLAQAGEFGFVLLSFSQQNHVLPEEITRLLSPIVALSMFLTPVLFIIFDKFIVKLYQNQEEEEREPDTIETQGDIIIAGVGRFGQLVNRMLVANGIRTVVLDHSATLIENLSKVNIKTYFGDATRPDLLHAAGIENIALIVIAIDDRYATTAMVEHIKRHYPKVKILARAYDRAHNYELEEAGADLVISETYYSAVEMGKEALHELGVHPFSAEQLRQRFLKTEADKHDELFASWQEETAENKFGQAYIKLFIELEKSLAEAMKQDRNHGHKISDRSWTPPPRDYRGE